MNIDLGVIDSPGRAVLVDDVIAVDHVTAPALALPGEIAADVFDVPAGNVHAVQLVECRRGGFDEVQGVVAEFAAAFFFPLSARESTRRAYAAPSRVGHWRNAPP